LYFNFNTNRKFKVKMPKQGGQGKGKPKLADRNFGKALIRRQLQGPT